MCRPSSGPPTISFRPIGSADSYVIYRCPPTPEIVDDSVRFAENTRFVSSAIASTRLSSSFAFHPGHYPDTICPVLFLLTVSVGNTVADVVLAKCFPCMTARNRWRPEDAAPPPVITSHYDGRFARSIIRRPRYAPCYLQRHDATPCFYRVN